MNTPNCKVYEPSLRYGQKVMRSLHYDYAKLIIHIQGERRWSFARVTFRKPIGFRVLDERDLVTFWENYNESRGWLYEVLEGGWLELEAQRGLTSLFMLGDELKEYLFVDEKCVSVLSTTAPEIEDLGHDPTLPDY